MKNSNLGAIRAFALLGQDETPSYMHRQNVSSLIFPQTILKYAKKMCNCMSYHN